MKVVPKLAEQLSGISGLSWSHASPQEFEGAHLESTVAPQNEAALADLLEALSGHGIAVLIRGKGSNLSLGHPSRSPRIWLSTELLNGVQLFDEEEGVLQAAAGTPLRSIEDAIEDSHWCLPVDPPQKDATLGGVLASGAIGPHVGEWGQPRDWVLGINAALSTGKRVRFGGRVVKNVTGYDLHKLFLGSLGSLGVLTSAWIRLRPRAQSRRVFQRSFSSLSLVSNWLRQHRWKKTPAVFAVVPGGALGHSSSWVAVAEFSGEAASVALQGEKLCQEERYLEADAGLMGCVRKQQGQVLGDIRVRISALPSAIVQHLSQINTWSEILVCYPNLGLIYLGCRGEGCRDQYFERVHSLVEAIDGSYVIESAPVDCKLKYPVFGPLKNGFRLHQLLKEKFDPAEILNPGRFIGRS